MIYYRKILLITLIIILVVLLGIMLWNYLHEKYGYDESKCYNYPEQRPFGTQMDSRIVDCRGYIYIDEDIKCSDDDLIINTQCGDRTIYDENRNVIIVDKLDNYRIIDNIIYVVGEIETNVITTNEGDKHIFYHYQINGEEQIVEVEEGDIIPRYMKINSQTSDIIPYKHYSEIPVEDRAVFEELENK